MKTINYGTETKPAEPIVRPETRPNRPNPGRINRPSVEPTPKA